MLELRQHVGNAAADRLEESDRKAREAEGVFDLVPLEASSCLQRHPQDQADRAAQPVVATALILLGVDFSWTIWMARSSAASDASNMQEVADALRQIIAEQRDQQGRLGVTGTQAVTEQVLNRVVGQAHGAFQQQQTATQEQVKCSTSLAATVDAVGADKRI